MRVCTPHTPHTLLLFAMKIINQLRKEYKKAQEEGAAFSLIRATKK
jgi:hypothetical protein